MLGSRFLFFSFNPSPPSFSHARALVEGLRRLRINYFNLLSSLSLSSGHARTPSRHTSATAAHVQRAVLTSDLELFN